jgi:hypothetical protein
MKKPGGTGFGDLKAFDSISNIAKPGLSSKPSQCWNK